MPNPPNNVIIQEITSLIADKTKFNQLEAFIESAKVMQQTAGVNLFIISNEYLQNLITVSIIHDNLAAAKLFINANVDINRGDMLGVTPLIAAIFTNNGPAVDMLIAAKADLNQSDLYDPEAEELILEASDEQKMAFKRCAKRKGHLVKRDSGYGFFNYYEYFYCNHQDSIVNTSRNTPLQIACCLGRDEIFHKLLAAGASVKSPSGRSSLLCSAVEKGQAHIVKTLLGHDDQDINFVAACDGYELSALDIAIYCKRLDFLKLLLEKKATGAYWCFKDEAEEDEETEKGEAAFVVFRCDDTGKFSPLKFDCTFEIDKEIIIFYIAKTIENYLDDLLKQQKITSENMVDFQFNANTAVFCSFTEQQLLTSLPTASLPQVVVNSFQVLLNEAQLHLLLAQVWQLKIALEEGNWKSGLVPVAAREVHFKRLYLIIGEYLLTRNIPAAYNFLSKTDVPQADILRVNMLFKQIMLSKGVKPLGIFPEMTAVLLQKQYPVEYAVAEKLLLDAGLEWLGIPRRSVSSPALSAPQQVITAKRTGSPLHTSDENKAARLAEETHASLPSPTP